VRTVLPGRDQRAIACAPSYRAGTSALLPGQSVPVVWPQIVVLAAACVVVLAIASAVGLRQEVRA